MAKEYLRTYVRTVDMYVHVCTCMYEHIVLYIQYTISCTYMHGVYLSSWMTPLVEASHVWLTCGRVGLPDLVLHTFTILPLPVRACSPESVNKMAVVQAFSSQPMICTDTGKSTR